MLCPCGVDDYPFAEPNRSSADSRKVPQQKLETR